MNLKCGSSAFAKLLTYSLFTIMLIIKYAQLLVINLLLILSDAIHAIVLKAREATTPEVVRGSPGQA